MIPFKFGKEFQESMVAYMLQDIGFAEKCSRYIEPALLHSDGLKWTFEAIAASIEKDGSIPSDIELEDKLKYVEVSKRKLLKMTVDDLVIRKVRGIDFLKQKLSDYARRIQYHKTFIESQGLYNTGKVEEAFTTTIDGMNSLYEITFEDDEILSGGDIEKFRKRYMHEMILAGTRFVPTLIAELDKILGGGLEKGRLGVLLAEPKKGKSIGLIHMTCMAVLMRDFKVAHFVLEGTTEETVMRIESRLSGIAYQKIYEDELLPEEEDELDRVQKLCKERLRIIPMNKHWDYTTLDVQGRIKELKRMGFDSDLVVLDYADLLKGRNKFSASEKRHEQTEVYRDMKKLAMSERVALWTASQAVRPKDAPEKEYLLRSKDISESYEKVRICDFIATLNMTVREKRLGILRFHADTYRSNDCDRTIRLVTNFGKMIFSSKKYPSLDTPSWKRKLKRR